MTTHWFAADFHFGHNRVAELRGFDSTEDHDAAVLAGLNRLRRGDTLWILGDVTMGGKHREIEALSTLSALASDRALTLHLVLGNHDRAHPMHTGSYRAERDAREHMSTVGTARRIKIGNGGRAMLSHFPYSGDHTEVERYSQWRLPDEGMTLIHGHTHSTEKVSHTVGGTLQVCVSIDAWDLRPASKQEIEAIIDRDNSPVPEPASGLTIPTQVRDHPTYDFGWGSGPTGAW